MVRHLGVIALLFGGVALAQPDARPEILVLGTFHMANRNHDAYNVQADDVFSPQRQLEIAQLLEVLKRYQPTKIAVENPETEPVTQEYSDYLAGKYKLSRDETNQVGYRLAKELGHKKVYSVNAWSDVEFPLERVANYAKAKGREAEFQATMSKWGTATKELDDYLRTHTVLETLEYVNSNAFIEKNVSPYFEILRLGDSQDWAGPELVSTWYQRNIRIYHNIRELIDSPHERILVVFGYGHLGWLQQDAQQDSAVRLRRLADLAAK